MMEKFKFRNKYVFEITPLNICCPRTTITQSQQEQQWFSKDRLHTVICCNIMRPLHKLRSTLLNFIPWTSSVSRMTFFFQFSENNNCDLLSRADSFSVEPTFGSLNPHTTGTIWEAWRRQQWQHRRTAPVCHCHAMPAWRVS